MAKPTAEQWSREVVGLLQAQRKKPATGTVEAPDTEAGRWSREVVGLLQDRRSSAGNSEGPTPRPETEGAVRELATRIGQKRGTTVTPDKSPSAAEPKSTESVAEATRRKRAAGRTGIFLTGGGGVGDTQIKVRKPTLGTLE